MDLQGQRDLLLLSELDRDGGATQRILATKLGVALGLTNLYLKRLARKGYIKITTIPRNRIRYLLTPQGVTEKSRLTYLEAQLVRVSTLAHSDFASQQALDQAQYDVGGFDTSNRLGLIDQSLFRHFDRDADRRRRAFTPQNPRQLRVPRLDGYARGD